MKVEIVSLKVTGDTEVLEEHAELVSVIVNEVIIPAVEVAIGGK